MTKIAEIEDRGATIAWSPVAEIADVIALGAKVCLFLAVYFQLTTSTYAQVLPIEKRFFSFHWLLIFIGTLYY